MTAFNSNSIFADGWIDDGKAYRLDIPLKKARTVPIWVQNLKDGTSHRPQSSWFQNRPFRPMITEWSTRVETKKALLLSPRMAELADAPDLKSGGGDTHVGSSPTPGIYSRTFYGDYIPN